MEESYFVKYTLNIKIAIQLFNLHLLPILFVQKKKKNRTCSFSLKYLLHV